MDRFENEVDEEDDDEYDDDVVRRVRLDSGMLLLMRGRRHNHLPHSPRDAKA